MKIFCSSILVSKLLKQGHSSWKLQTTFRKFYGRHSLNIIEIDDADLNVDFRFPTDYGSFQVSYGIWQFGKFGT